MNRRSIRLSGYDYTQSGAYFLTLVTHQRQLLFGEICSTDVQLNALGMIVMEEWNHTPIIRKEIELDEFVIMPNHIHGIIQILESGAGIRVTPVGALGGGEVGAHGRAPLRLPKSVGSFVAGFKSVVTKRINLVRGTPGFPVWQRNYYEHVIRDEDDLARIRAYIQANPFSWKVDNENPGRSTTH